MQTTYFAGFRLRSASSKCLLDWLSSGRRFPKASLVVLRGAAVQHPTQLPSCQSMLRVGDRGRPGLGLKSWVWRRRNLEPGRAQVSVTTRSFVWIYPSPVGDCLTNLFAIVVMVAQEAETFYDRLLRRASNANLGFVAVLGRLSSTAVSCFRRR